jgi:starch synthase
MLDAPEPELNPAVVEMLRYNYGPKNHMKMKAKNKLCIQKILDLDQDENAVMFFWPSRLDPVQKGCQLLAQIMYDIVSQYRDVNLQIVSVASGEYQTPLYESVR